MTAHRYWRIKVNETNSGSILTLSEIRFLDESETIISPSSVSVDPAISYNTVADFTDNNTATWAGFNASYPHYIQFDYGSDVEPAYVDICDRSDGWPEQAPKSFDIQYSDNNSTWTTLKSYSSIAPWSTFEWRRFALLNNPSYKELRIYITNVFPAGSSECTLAEVIMKDSGGSRVLAPSSYPDPYPGFGPTSNVSYSGYQSANAYDGNSDTIWYGGGASSSTYIGYIFPISSPSIATITLQADSSFPAKSPKDFNIKFSGDSGSTWDTILTRTDEAAWAASELRTYDLPDDYDYTAGGVLVRRRYSPCAG